VSILVARVPDAPLNLADVAIITNAYQVGLNWQDGTYNGASIVLDYRVSFKPVADGDYIVFASGIITRSITVSGLNPGVYYSFYVESRNIIGYSSHSDPITVLAAQIPDPATSLANVPSITTAYQIGLFWVAPAFNGGSAVLNYRLWYDDATGSSLTIFAETISGLSYTATGLLPGKTYEFKIEARNAYGFSVLSSPVSVLAAQTPDAPSLANDQ